VREIQTQPSLRDFCFSNTVCPWAILRTPSGRWRTERLQSRHGRHQNLDLASRSDLEPRQPIIRPRPVGDASQDCIEFSCSQRNEWESTEERGNH
jgi:hypothetical protein